MKNLDDIAKEHGIDNIDLGNAVSAVIACEIEGGEI